jgi:dTDP-4-amino-4,6-dideoxygalactose transaminase
VGPEYPLSRDELHGRLREHGIVARRYFYPLIAEFPMYRGLPSAAIDNLPVAAGLSRSVLCLPIYPDLDLATVDRISELIATP